MILKILLYPFSALYGIIVGMRNFMYTFGILKAREFKVPVICVGNLTVGGTGKTPHTEMIISELRKKYRVASLSRGYKRKTSGFILADKTSTAEDIGDEPLQIKLKFPDIIVACDEKRVRGIENLLALDNPPEVIILDDAFQHRKVNAGINILLSDYNRPVYKDILLPAGRLRESRSAIKRADLIIVTKSPGFLTPLERRLIFKHLKIKPYQKLFFTTTIYGNIEKLSPQAKTPVIRPESAILCVTGIAKPEPYITHLQNFTKNVTEISYPDHHHFTEKDIRQISHKFAEIKAPEKYIFTTEKDAVRFRSMDLPKDIRNKIFYIPVEPSFLAKKDLFFNEIENYVGKNKR